MIEAFATDFSQDVEFERYVLSKAAPIVLQSGSSSSAEIFLDNRPKTVRLGASETLGRSSAQFIEDLGLRPLLFGTAWKMLDILVDHVLKGATGQSRFTIKDKVSRATQGVVIFSPLDAYPDLLARVWAAYAGAEQYRHSLIHRRAAVAPNGDFTGVDPNGKALGPLNIAEQEAFSRMVQWVVACVLSGDLPQRKQQRLGAEVDALSALTGLPSLGYLAPQLVVPAVTVPVTSADVIDMKVVKDKVYGTFSSVKEVDVTFRVEDLGDVRFLCELEQTPDERITLDADTNVPWLQRL